MHAYISVYIYIYECMHAYIYIRVYACVHIRVDLPLIVADRAEFVRTYILHIRLHITKTTYKATDLPFIVADRAEFVRRMRMEAHVLHCPGLGRV